MSLWLIADLALLPGLVVCAWVMFRSKDLADWLVALQMGGVVTILILLILSQAMNRPSFFDLGLALAILSVPSTLMFSHFVQRWLG